MRIILFTGKGGVGKTTMAAATASRLAGSGLRVAVLSTDGAHSLGDSFGVPLDNTPRTIATNLDALEVDPASEGEGSWAAIREQLGRILGANESITAEEMVLFPGLSELFSLLRILELADSGAYDALVVDCAPTGETLSLLRYPERFAEVINRALPLKRKMVKAIGPAVEKLTSIPMPKDQAFAELDHLTNELQRLQALLSDDEISTLRIVTTPERVPVVEARRNYTWLHLYGYTVDAVLVNRVLPEAALAGYFTPYAERQAEAFDAVREGFCELPVFTVELQASEVVGLEALGELASRIYRDADPAGVLASGRPFEVERNGGAYTLTIPLPNATRDDLTLDQRGTDLVLTLRGARRLIALPDALIGRQVNDAKLTDGVLQVRFGRP